MKKAYRLLLVLMIVSTVMLGVFGCDSDDQANGDDTITYRITFDSMGGSSIASIEVKQGSTLSVPTVTKVGHTLEGWYTSVNEGVTLDERWSFVNDTVNSDLTLYANWEINAYTISFDSDGGTEIDAITQDFDTKVTAPKEPTKEGHTFIGWSQAVPEKMPANNLDLVAQWEINHYTLVFEDYDGTVLYEKSFQYGHDLSELDLPEATREGFTFIGWHKDLPAQMPAHNITVYALYELTIMPNMVIVGEAKNYVVPSGYHDNSTVNVVGGFHIAKHLTTYELWYEVRIWAEENGYDFANQGREGSHGIDGAAPTDAKQEPITKVSWVDVIVWLNALSEMHGIEPVYRDIEDRVIRDARDANAADVDLTIQTDHNGYRLPTSDEWEMAARWKEDVESTDGSIEVGERYWTPGNYASGATSNVNHDAATQVVAWYQDNSDTGNGLKTHPVGQLQPNHLGIYDMSGNAWEWTFTVSGFIRVIRGGSYRHSATTVAVGYTTSDDPFNVNDSVSFRIVRNP